MSLTMKDNLVPPAFKGKIHEKIELDKPMEAAFKIKQTIIQLEQTREAKEGEEIKEDKAI